MLKKKLIRRGVALPASLVAAGATVQSATLHVPVRLMRTMFTCASRYRVGGPEVSFRAVKLAEGVLKVMFIQKLGMAAAVLMTVAFAAGTFGMTYGISMPRDKSAASSQPPAEKPAPAPIRPRIDANPGSGDAVSLAINEALPAAIAAADPYTFTFALSREVTYPYPRAHAQAFIAGGLARAGDIEGALALAKSIGRDAGPLDVEDLKAEVPGAMAEIAREQIRIGERDGAKKTLREALTVAESMSRRESVLSERLRHVAEALGEIGDIDGIKTAISVVKGDTLEEILTLVVLARAQGKAGDLASAAATLRQALKLAGELGPRKNFINDDPTANADSAFGSIAIARAETGDVKGAREIVSSRGFNDWQSNTLAEIAANQARAGDIVGALDTVRSIPVPVRAVEAYSTIASVQAGSGDESAALSWTSRLPAPDAKVFALIGLLEGRAARTAAKPKAPPPKP